MNTTPNTFLLKYKLRESAVVDDYVLPQTAQKQSAAFFKSNIPLCLAQAPTGFGKSQLMGHLYTQQSQAVWLSVDAQDQDPMRLFLHLFAALAPLYQDGQDRIGLFQQQRSWNPDYVFYLLNPEQLQAGTLFVDDLHCLNATPDLLVLLGQWLIETGLKVVCSSEHTLSWPTEKWRAGRQLTLLTPEDLRWSRQETQDYFQHPASAQVFERLQGWPLGCSLFKEQHLQTDLALDNLALGEEFLQSYCESEILPQLNATEMNFLKAASMIPHVTHEQVQIMGGHKTLLSLLKKTPFLYRHGHAGYRMAPFAKDWVWGKLTPEEKQTWTHTWVDHFLKNEAWRAALEVAAQLPQNPRLPETLKTLAPRLMGLGQIPLLKWHLAPLTPSTLNAHPELRLYAGMIAALTGDLSQAKQDIFDLESVPYDETLKREHTLYLRSLLARREGKTESLLQLSHQLLEPSPQMDLIQAGAWFNKGLAQMMQGQWEAAEQSLSESIVWNQKTHSTITFFASRTCQAQCRLKMAQLQVAKVAYEDILDDLEKAGFGSHSLCGTIYSNLASIAYYQGQIQDMPRLLDNSLALAKMAYNNDYIFTCVNALRLLMAAHDYEASQRYLQDMLQSSHSHTFQGLTPHLQRLQKELALWQKKEPPSALSAPYEQFVYHWVRHQWEQAHSAFENWLGERKGTPSLLEELKTQCYALFLQTKVGQAQPEQWEYVLTQLAQTGAFQIFKDTWPAPDFSPLKQALSALPLPLQQAWNAQLELSDSPLTERERELLTCLEKGMKNQDIAEQLFVSPNTIKTHLKNMFRKMDVKNRTAAVAKGREMGWLE